MFKWNEAVLLHQEEIAPNTRHFWLKTENDASFSFKAGQFITLDLPIAERRRQRWRSYSLVNPPNGNGAMELCIVRNPTGKGTQYLFDTLKTGQKLLFKGPDGVFCLPDSLQKDIVLICTGTGIAPFRSMVLDVFSTQKTQHNINLIFGTRHESNILYRKEFEDLAQKTPQFHYDITLSKPQGWNGNKGYVHDIYLEKYKKVREDICFYICGWKNMVDEANKNLLNLGYKESQIIYELYG